MSKDNGGNANLAVDVTQSGWSIIAQDQNLGQILCPSILGTNASLKDKWVASSHAEAAWVGEMWAVHDAVTIEASAISVERTLTNQGDSAREVEFDCTFRRSGQPSTTIIPGVQYQGNHWGTGNEPKGYDHQGVPWSFATSRTTVPAATIVDIDAITTGLYIPVATMPSLLSSCSLIMHADGCDQQICWPWREAPLSYIGRDRYGDPWTGSLTLQSGQCMTFSFRLVIATEPAETEPWHAILRDAWQTLGSEVIPWHTPTEIRDLCRCFVKENLVATEDDYTLLSIGLTKTPGNQWIQRRSGRYEIGWCGQNASLANAMLEWSLETGEESLWELGTKVLDSWQRARLDCGLIATHLDPILEHRPMGPLDTCNLGVAAYQYLRAYSLSSNKGQKRSDWLDTGLRICSFFLTDHLQNGKFGKAWSEKGEAVDPDGTIGSYLLPPLVYAWQITGNAAYLRRAEVGFWAYVNEDLANLEVTAGALDTHCIDKESAYPILKAAVMLYQATNDERYIQAAQSAAYYLTSWMYHFDVPLSDTTVLGRMGYRTTGGTTVSVQHHHIDPWGAAIAPDLLHLSRLTNDSYWRQIGLAMWNQSTLGVWDGRPTPDNLARPNGSQDEGWCQTNWLAPGETTKWLVAWPAAFHLEGWKAIPVGTQQD